MWTVGPCPRLVTITSRVDRKDKEFGLNFFQILPSLWTSDVSVVTTKRPSFFGTVFGETRSKGKMWGPMEILYLRHYSFHYGITVTS